MNCYLLIHTQPDFVGKIPKNKFKLSMISKIKIINYKMLSQQSLKSLDDWIAIAVLWRVLGWRTTVGVSWVLPALFDAQTLIS